MRAAPLLLTALFLMAPPLEAFQGTPNSRPAAPAQAPIELAARYKEAYLTFPEIDELVLSRYAESKLGRETRLFMLKMGVVDSVARERGVVAEAFDIQSMLDDVERGVIANGVARDIDEYLLQQGVSRDQFLASLRLAVLQTKLSRRDLKIPQDQPITGEQQEMWLDTQINERGLEELPAPWDSGVVLRSGDVEILRDKFITFLRGRVDPDEMRVCLFELLRVKRMKARMPDLDPAALAAAVETEIENRRIEVQSDPKYKGITYEQLLRSQGVLYERWRSDPNVVQSALARLWVQRTYDEEALRAAYENERSYFDSQFGEALEASVLFLRATDIPNELIKRTHASAEAELTEIAKGIHSLTEFQKVLDIWSEDRNSRLRKGYLGWVTRTGNSGPSPAREALFAALDSGEFKPSDPQDSVTRLVGPVRTDAGVLLLWVGQRRPKPGWSTMVVYVHKTLRERFTDEALVPEETITFVDPL